jgi:ParB/RepB/Spo0J family partition protein
MSITAAEPTANSAPNAAREKAWRAEIHTPEAEYNANVPVDAIERDPANRVPTAEAVAERADSIEKVGLLQPIVLRDLGGGKYRLIAGEHRWLAFRKLKRKTIAARIYKGETDVSSVEKSLIENLARTDLSPIERAKRFKQLSELGRSQKEIGALCGGISQPVVANAIRMLELPEEPQKMVDSGELSEAHGVALVKFARWPRVVAYIARQLQRYPWTAKQIQTHTLPFSDGLVHEKLVQSINTGSHYSGPLYVLPGHLKSHADFIVGEYTTYYVLPENPKDNVWAPEQKKQDDEREKKDQAAKAREAKSAAKGGGKSKEQAERQKLILKNKTARAKVAVGLAHAVVAMRAGKKGAISRGLHVVVESALDSYKVQEQLAPAAEAIGLKLPKKPASGAWRSHRMGHKWLHSLGDEALVRLVATAVMMKESKEAHRCVWEVPEGVEYVGAKGGEK